MNTPIPPTNADDLELLTSCATREEAFQVGYALGLRRIACRIGEPRPSTLGGRRGEFRVLVPKESLERAREALPYIVGAMFGEALALDAQGRCVMCGYDMRGVTRTTICPECGVDLASAEAKRHAARRQ
ncbi:MAG: hypothetical protein R3B57_11475 [Phycisphaerales bacterium]